MHKVALLRDSHEDIEKLFGHEVALVMRVEGIHTVLDYVGAQLLILVFVDSHDVRHGAQTHQQVCHALGQVQVIEQTLDEVLLGNDVVKELLRLLDQPE